MCPSMGLTVSREHTCLHAEKCSCLRAREDIWFFQAEDCLRYIGVTGVQTCALPIYAQSIVLALSLHHAEARLGHVLGLPALRHGPDVAAVVDVGNAEHGHLRDAAHLVEGAAGGGVESGRA